jgi:hypothetical protein
MAAIEGLPVELGRYGATLLERLGWASIRSGIKKRHTVAGPSLSVEGRHDTGPS